MGEVVAVCAAGLVALAAGRVWLGYAEPPLPLRVLARREFAFLRAAADATFPAGGALHASGSDAEVAEHTDAWMVEVAPRMRRLMRLLFFLVEHATLLFPAPGSRGRRRFSALAPEQQEAALRGWAESALAPRRLVFQSLRAVLTLGYLSDPAVLRELGLAPRDLEPAYGEADLLFPPVGHGAEAIRVQPEDLRDVEAPATLACDAPLDPRYAATEG